MLKPRILLMIIGICLLIGFIAGVVHNAMKYGAPATIEPVGVTDRASEKTGDIRTDVVLCYQAENGEKSLVNLSYQHSANWLDEYPAELLEVYDIQPGDFAEIEYQAEYSTGGEDGHHQYIRNLLDVRQIFAEEALSRRNLYHTQDIWRISRTADAYPIQINQNAYADFVMIPAEEKYYLFFPYMDKPLIFDEYKRLTKELEINGETKQLHLWVLCNDTISDEEMLNALYQGKVVENRDFFFIGYDSPYPYSFTANGFDQEGLYQMKKFFIPNDSAERYAYHLTTKELENTDYFSTLPKLIQQELNASWNHIDDVLLFGGDYDITSELTFNDDNQLCLSPGNSDSSGYVVIYLESGFFEEICSGIA